MLSKELKLLFWNDKKELPQRIMALRMAFIILGIVGSVVYLLEPEDILEMGIKSNKKIRRASGKWYSEWQINSLKILMTLSIILASR
tara:strand:- start:778 stop:1038 length:261 start_codon:yes stop_codon:yes gene_type:complete